jgi:hypothetical protein
LRKKNSGPVGLIVGARAANVMDGCRLFFATARPMDTVINSQSNLNNTKCNILLFFDSWPRFGNRFFTSIARLKQEVAVMQWHGWSRRQHMEYFSETD